MFISIAILFVNTMPTPSDDTLLQLSQPTDISDSRSLHTTCPPEEDREHHAPREPRAGNATQPHVNSSTQSAPIASMPTPDERDPPVDVEAGAAERSSLSPPTTSKSMDAVEEALMRDVPTPSSPVEDPKDSDARLAHSMSAAAISTSLSSTHLGFPSTAKRVRQSSTASMPIVLTIHAAATSELDVILPSPWQQVPRHPTVRSSDL